MVSRDTLTISFEPFTSQLVGCLHTYTFFDVDNPDYDEDLLTFDPDARTIDVYSLDDTKAREYNLRVRGKIN